MTNLYLSISPQEASRLLTQTIINNSVTGELIDEYSQDVGDGRTVIVLVYEKHYFRAENRLTLTAVIDNISGKTHIHAISGGGGKGLFKVDYGASDSFEESIFDAFYKYIIKE